MFVLMGCTQDNDDVSSNDSEITDPQQLGFKAVNNKLWNELSVKKVLHTFAYGGLAIDTQITLWANMTPESAINEILTFSYTNNKLSPATDDSSHFANSIQNLQAFWSSTDGSNFAIANPDYNNPMLWNKRGAYETLNKKSQLSKSNFQRAWIQAVNARGINPFIHKVAYYLSNYQMAINILTGAIGLTRDYYDQILFDLVAGIGFVELIANASKSAAVAKRYDHRSNKYNNDFSRFSGNDDFAREFFQLFFRYQGETESQDYHENVTIENMALLLTGMDIDKKIFNYGSNASNEWWVAPLNFSDHVDDFRDIDNESNHYAACLEVLHEEVCGINADEKITVISTIVAHQQEVLDNLPVFIIASLANDQLSDQDKQEIRESWLITDDNLLQFIRSYAISTQFHNTSRVKYMSSVDRNISLYNAVVVDNEEALSGRSAFDSPLPLMVAQGATPFEPSHDVFGGQTGVEASKSSYIFKHAFATTLHSFGSGLTRYERSYYTDDSFSELATWVKDWSRILLISEAGGYRVDDIANQLWQRIMSDAGKNMDRIAKSHIYSLLTYGHDFGYQVTIEYPLKSSDPIAAYGSELLNEDNDLINMLNTMSSSLIMLDSSDSDIRKEANRRVNLAVAFISMMPYTFAETGQ